MGITEIALLSIIVLMPLGGLFDLRQLDIEPAQKTIWTLIIVLIPFFGPVSYLIYARINYQYKS